MGISKRNARSSVAALLLKWRNSPSVREFSQNSEAIGIEDHLAWLLERLAKIRFEPFFIFELGHESVGMSRLDFEVESADKFAISILVDPEQRSKGTGTAILNMTCEIFFNLHPSYTLVATVHTSNHISQKLFLRAGFQLQNTLGEFLYFEKTV